MVHKLAVIAIVGLTASAVCIGAAAAIGGKDFKDGMGDFSWFDSKPRCEAIAGATASSRDLDWDGSDEVTLALLGQASYSPGTDDRLHASGDPQVLAHLRVRDGKIEMDCRGWRNRTRDVTITLPGREFREFTIASGGKMVLDKLNQSKAEIIIAGAGNVKANGRIDDLEMTIAGSGDADFNQLTARKAEFGIAGSGTIKAKGSVDELEIGIAGSGHGDFDGMTSRTASAEIRGSGTVNAKGKIDNVKIDISGSGNADFGQMETRTAEVEISGHGDVHIAPSERAKIEISGSGDVYLRKDPKTLDTQMHGSGRVHKAGAGG
ncbi:MAG TPA: DUF2807 domain-containing protein [Rhizomicrobium sp.]|nr:DUF2807 domain-containing protein [Rhizomicrobium sp.]HKY17606.1 DUF2807 domain-containing protein [Rhizomicrobium sp.]